MTRPWQTSTRPSASIRRTPRVRRRGMAWLEKEENNRAMADLDQAIRLDPNDATIYRWRSAAWLEKHEIDKAIVDYEQASDSIPRTPGSTVPRVRLGRERRNMTRRSPITTRRSARSRCGRPMGRGVRPGMPSGSTTRRWPTTTRRSDSIPNSPRPRLPRLVLDGQGEYDKAIADFDQAIRLDPKLADAYCGRTMSDESSDVLTWPSPT